MARQHPRVGDILTPAALQLRAGAAGPELHAAPGPARSAQDREAGAGLVEISGVVLLDAGEWVPAWLGLSVTFLVASLGVVGLGWWVLRGDARNPAAEEALESPAESEHTEVHH